MAFNVTSQAGRLAKSIGAYTELAVGMTTASGGDVDFNVPGLSRVDGVTGTVQGATTVSEVFIAVSTSGNNVVGEIMTSGGAVTGSSVLMYFAWGLPNA